MTCASCKHSEYDPRTAPILHCVKHGDEAKTPCAQYSRCPGADEPEEIKK